MSSLLQQSKATAGFILFTVVTSACAPVGSGSSNIFRGLASENDPKYVAPIPRASSSTNIKVCEDDTTVPGIDVSAWNPNINWPKVKMGGKDFVFIKATEGNGYISSVFASDWATAKSSGLLRGAYHYFRPSVDPVEQAEIFLKTMGDLGQQDLPAVLDWESSDGISASVQIERAKVWLELVEAATGKIPIIYTGPSFWNSLGNPEAFVRNSLFIANYAVSCPWIPAPWNKWTFWQYTDDGIVSGTSGNTDLDVFNGTLDELKRFAQKGYL